MTLTGSSYPAAIKLLRTIPQILRPPSSTSPITTRTLRLNQICKIAFESPYLAFESVL
ncbi:hypothetical protein HanIR_Chr03g0141001 [Helianthus annuus]|nr:hypothetical protein HanIR_Chr03g0141001 [Helianthus annuus]